jgi:hypothetical protein
VVQLYGSFEDERHVSLVMEHCTAGDLFKTMLVHGGVLDEHWVAIQVRSCIFLGSQDISPHDIVLCDVNLPCRIAGRLLVNRLIASLHCRHTQPSSDPVT